MNERHNSVDGHDEPDRYAIRFKGHLTYPWWDWLDNVTLDQTDDGDTILTCSIVDQAALHGVLKKVRDLGLKLVSINRVEND